MCFLVEFWVGVFFGWDIVGVVVVEIVELVE